MKNLFYFKKQYVNKILFTIKSHKCAYAILKYYV